MRQRMSSTWILAGIAVACVLGGFQNLSRYDTGTRGELEPTSGLYPPFPGLAAGVARAAVSLALALGTWWLATRTHSPTASVRAEA
jgi:hypothetical protein